MTVSKGKILGIQGVRGNGLAFLVLEDEDLGLVKIPCDKAPTVEALESCFGNVIGPEFTVNNKSGGHIGQEIYYSQDDILGILDGFSPVQEASPELIRIYESERAHLPKGVN